MNDLARDNPAWMAGLLERLGPVRPLYDDGILEAAAGDWLAEQFDRGADPAFAERFRGIAQKSGAPAETFLHRVLDLGGTQVLAGIRFYGGDPDRPFLDLFAWTRVPDWPALAAAFPDCWAPFAPRDVRLIAAAPPDGVSARLDQGIHLGRVSDMPRSTVTGISLEAIGDAEAAADFVGRAYAEAIRDAPELDGEIHAADAETLAACRDEGTLHWILAEGEQAGLIATQRDRIEMLPGALIVEETVRGAFRGRSLARAAQGLLAAEMAASAPGQVLMGTIYANNRASCRTAEGAGRPARLSYWFVQV